VPYRNLGHVQAGTPLYGCGWGLVRCARVGEVISVLDGEAQGTHPHGGAVQRGVMIDVDLADAAAGEQDVLFLGSKPLGWL